MRRHLLAVITIVVFVIAAILWKINYTDQAKIFVRVGMVLLAIWLALPQVRDMASKVSPWVVFTVIGCIFIVAVTKNVLIVAPILMAIGIAEFIKYLFKPLPPRAKRPPQSTGQKPGPGPTNSSSSASDSKS